MNWLKNLWQKILAWFGAQPDEPTPDTPDTPDQPPTVPQPVVIEAGSSKTAPGDDLSKEWRDNGWVSGMQTTALARRADRWIRKDLAAPHLHFTRMGDDIFVTCDDFQVGNTVYKYEIAYIGTSASENWNSANPLKLTKDKRHDVLRLWFTEHKPK